MQNNEQDKDQLKREREWKMRRNLRILALLIAAYYFASAGYAWYQESLVEEQNTVKVSTISNAKDFRKYFNDIINKEDTSLPTANANDSKDGFIAVLSPSIEMRGIAKGNSHELSSVQIQTIYTNALPPESLLAFKAFIATCEGSKDLKVADDILLKLNIIPEYDKNESDKIFEEISVKSNTMKYQLKFINDEIDTLTIVATSLDPISVNNDVVVVE